MRISDWSSDVCSSDLLRFEGRAQEGAGRSLAVGAGDVEGTGELELRIAEPRAQLGDTLEPQNVAPRRQRGETIELGLDGGVGAMGVVGHWRVVPNRSSSLRAKRSNPGRFTRALDCRLASLLAMTMEKGQAAFSGAR